MAGHEADSNRLIPGNPSERFFAEHSIGGAYHGADPVTKGPVQGKASGEAGDYQMPYGAARLLRALNGESDLFVIASGPEHSARTHRGSIAIALIETPPGEDPDSARVEEVFATWGTFDPQPPFKLGPDEISARLSILQEAYARELGE